MNPQRGVTALCILPTGEIQALRLACRSCSKTLDVSIQTALLWGVASVVINQHGWGLVSDDDDLPVDIYCNVCFQEGKKK